MNKQELWNKFQFIYNVLGWQKEDRKSFIDALHTNMELLEIVRANCGE